MNEPTTTVEVVADPAPFVQMPVWLLEADVSDRAVRVYAALMSYAGARGGEAWPSKRAIADRCRCSPASIWRAIAELEAVGAVTVVARHNEQGQTTNRYVIHWTPSRRRDAPHREDAMGPIAGTRRGTRSRELEETPLPPEPASASTRSTAAREDEPEGFADWYGRYPRHVGRRAAARAYRAARRRGVTVEALDAALTAWLPALREREARFVPYPATFLNSGDGDAPPPDAAAPDAGAPMVVRGHRSTPSERIDPTLTPLWHRIEAERVRDDHGLLAALFDEYARRAAEALGIDVTEAL